MIKKRKFSTYSNVAEDDENLNKENVTLPLKVGDEVLMGRFKNKRVKIKSITTNAKGDLLINGRPALKFRMKNGGKVLLPKNQ